MRFAGVGGAARAEPAPDAPDPLALAYAEGHAAGVAEATAAAEAEAMVNAAARQHLTFSFSRLDAGALSRRVECAVAMFVRADDERVIRLHPDDLTLIAGQLPSGWQFIPDPALERGALRIETSSGGIEDGPAQWRAAITEALRLC